jgi:hypothetical protein
MKIWAFIVAFVLINSPIAWAESVDEELLYNFLQGSYELIGRWPDSNETYIGRVLLKKSNRHFKVVRTGSNKRIEGVGKIETATADNVRVLRIRFSKAGRTYEGTYLIDSDLDNYGRLTGYLYLKEGGTKKVGLEALFSDHGQLRRE